MLVKKSLTLGISSHSATIIPDGIEGNHETAFHDAGGVSTSDRLAILGSAHSRVG